MNSPQIVTAAGSAEKPSGTRQLNSWRRLIGTIISPRETFRDIDRKPDWLLPLLVAVLTSIIVTLLTTQHIRQDPSGVARRAIERDLQKQGKSMSDLSEKDKVLIEGQVKWTGKVLLINYLIGVILVPVAVVMLAFIYTFFLTFLDGDTTYLKVFSVTAYAYGLVYICIPMLLRLLSGVLGVRIPTGLSALMPASVPPTINAVVASMDIFTIWFLILVTIGFAAVTKKMRIAKAGGIVFGLWGGWILLRVVWAAFIRR